MSGMLRILSIVLLVTASLGASAARSAEPGLGVKQRLSDTPVLRGEFEQEKSLQGFRHPLLSKGDFLLARKRGVVWNTRSPFASSIVLTRERLSTRQADGSRRDLLAKGDSPAVRTANALLMALLGGNVSALSQQFVLKETLLPEGAWTLELVPKPGGLQKVFRRIELQGNRQVRRVQLEEVSGDRTTIRFLNLRETPGVLDPREARQFD